jgi:misacylated tRNA(Ala) deacylase
MTELIYQTDSYASKFTARVTEVDPDNHTVILDRTAFYPGGGGQPFDLGVIRFAGNEVPLIRAQKREIRSCIVLLRM